MKKLGVAVKEITEKQVKDNLKKSESVFVIKYSGLSSPDITSLRMSLKGSGARLFVVKNSVARRSLKDAGLDGLIKSIDGPCGLVFIKEEAVGASKALYNFAKDHDKLKLEGGYLKDKVLETNDIVALAKLPSREVLLTQLVMTLNSPIRGLVVTLHRTLGKFVICLDKIRQKKT